ncbi:MULTISPECIES: ABC transporter permease [unclassified Paenibacillus]|jgi:ABC-2 type transport system permease protein|uniref:ABC transporter permease n=1 Tax=unclassified Paenibacillus TaxID=185978 RepID=UPI0004F90A86|nr:MULTISPECIES: ABC transporter permease [unclassified Paenibacillus]AIQ26133.1 hypothetical protein H70737_26820 [Paenibacillus sp. FSL H7-0737]KAA1188681.1 ABC transporter permease [Paenibacillus sp. B2(2019)]
MIIFQNNLKRLFKKKGKLITMLVIPIVFTMIIIGGSVQQSKYKVGIADEDKTPYTQMIQDKLSKDSRLIVLKKEDIQDQLINNKIDYAIQIDQGLTEKLIQGQDAKIKTFSVEESDATLPIKMDIQSFTNAAANIGKSSGGSSESFYEGLKLYQNGSFTSELKVIEDKGRDLSQSLRALGFLVMSMVFLITTSTTMIIEDKTSGVYKRLLYSPMKQKSYMLQNILSFLGLSVFQILIVFYVMIKGFKLDMGTHLVTLILFFMLFSLVCISMGVLVSSFSSTTRQANALIGLINVPICMLGGCFWPREMMPSVLKGISEFVPTTWILIAAEKILNGKGFSSLYLETGVLLLFFLLLFLLSSIRKPRIV